MTLGGTYDIGETNLDVDLDTKKMILSNCMEIEPALMVGEGNSYLDWILTFL